MSATMKGFMGKKYVRRHNIRNQATAAAEERAIERRFRQATRRQVREEVDAYEAMTDAEREELEDWFDEQDRLAAMERDWEDKIAGAA